MEIGSRIGARRKKGAQESQKVMEDNRGWRCQSLPSSHCSFCTRIFLTYSYIAVLHPHTTQPLHYTVALDSGNEASYVLKG